MKAFRIVIGSMVVLCGLLIAGLVIARIFREGFLFTGGGLAFASFLVMLGLIIAGRFKVRDFY